MKKRWEFWSLVVGLLTSVFVLASYGYNVSAFAASLASRVGFLEERRVEDKEDLKYIRDRVDQIYNRLPQDGTGRAH